MRGILMLTAVLALAACGPAAKKEDTFDAPAAPVTDNDYTLERKPTPGDPASALIFDDKLILRVFGDDGSISEAVITLQPSAPPPAGMTRALGLEGEGWVLHPVSVATLGARDRNGLCKKGSPTFVLKRVDADGSVTFAGFTGQNVTETDPANRCETFRFLP